MSYVDDSNWLKFKSTNNCQHLFFIRFKWLIDVFKYRWIYQNLKLENAKYVGRVSWSHFMHLFELLVWRQVLQVQDHQSQIIPKINEGRHTITTITIVHSIAISKTAKYAEETTYAPQGKLTRTVTKTLETATDNLTSQCMNL